MRASSLNRQSTNQLILSPRPHLTGITLQIDEPAFQAGVHLALVRTAAAFGRRALGVDITEPQRTLRIVLEEYDDSGRRTRPRFITVFVDLGLSGYIAREMTGDRDLEFDAALARDLRDTLLATLNSWTHDDD